MSMMLRRAAGLLVALALFSSACSEPKKSKVKSASVDEDDDPPKKSKKTAYDPDGVMCGGAPCNDVCCTTFGKPVCRKSTDGCPHATNGEMSFASCDGPEDCGAGEVCCTGIGESFVMSWTRCTTRSKCSGSTTNQKYGVTQPNQMLCRDNDDCSDGALCMKRGLEGGISAHVCK